MSGIPVLNVNDTYDFSNSDVFYSLVNAHYLNYYQKTIRVCQQWLDGFVPSFHKAENGIVSSRIAAKITKGIRNQIYGRGLVFTKGKATTGTEGLDFISHEWAEESKFQNVVKQMIGYAVPLGTALIKVNANGKGKLWCEALRADYFYFSADSRGEPTSVTTYVKVFSSTEQDKESYCLCERRYYKREPKKFTSEINGEKLEFKQKEYEDVPYIINEVYKINATSNNNSLAAGQPLGWKTIPSEVRNAINRSYGNLIIGQEKKLPFKSIGCFIFKNEGGDITRPSMPFGSPMLLDLIADFMEYDLDKSYSIRDLANSKGVVGLPKGLTQSALVPGTGGSLEYGDNGLGQTNIPGFEYIKGLDPNTQKPIISQFEIRAKEHEEKQNAILKSIATSIGMSPRVIASYLVDGKEKTAEQTHSEDDTVSNWVKTHRADYIQGINDIIELVLSYNGMTDNVKAKFASDGLMDESRKLDLIEKKLDLGIINLEDAIREEFPDYDEEQLKAQIDKMSLAMAKKKKQEQVDLDPFANEPINDGEPNVPKLAKAS